MTPTPTQLLKQIAEIEWKTRGNKPPDQPLNITPAALSALDLSLFHITLDGTDHHSAAARAVSQEIDKQYLKKESQFISVVTKRLSKLTVLPAQIEATTDEEKLIKAQAEEYLDRKTNLLTGFLKLLTREEHEIETAITYIHETWLFTRQTNSTLEHPLRHIVIAWLDDQKPIVQPEQRPRRILPQELRDSRRVEGEFLPVGITQPPTATIETLWLPGFENPSIIVPPLPLEIYKATGGKVDTPGRGAPLSQRLWIYTVAASPLGTRNTKGGVTLATTLRQLRDWAYPNGWERKRHLPKLRAALHEMHNYRISWERRDWSIVTVKALPDSSTQLDDPLPIEVWLPDGIKGNGPMINMTILMPIGVKSAPQFRAYIRLVYIWDDAKKKNNGHRIYATRPKVLRNNRGQVTDAYGAVLPKNNWNHPKAVWIDEEDNPAAKHVPVLTNLDMVHLFFDDKPTSKSTCRKRLERAKTEAQEMHENGFVVIQPAKHGWRILEPKLENVTKYRPHH